MSKEKDFTSEIDEMISGTGPLADGESNVEPTEITEEPEGGEETKEISETTEDEEIDRIEAGEKVEEGKVEGEEVTEKEAEPELEESAVTEETKPEGKAAEVVEDEPSELELLQRQNELLMGRVEQLTSVEAPVAETPATEQETIKKEVFSILGDYDIDDVVSRPELFNEVIMKAVEYGRKTTTESVLRSIPSIVVTHIRQQKVLGDAVEEFYQNNEDLRPVRKTVGVIANQLVADNPDWPLEKVFEQSAAKTREVLGLRAKALGEKPKSNVRVRKPALIKKTGGGGDRRPIKDQLNDLQKDINDTLDL